MFGIGKNMKDKNDLSSISKQYNEYFDKENDTENESSIGSKQKEVFGVASREKMYNNQYDYMTGEEFEVFVADILGNIGFINIQFTRASGDQGVDIIAERDGIKYAIQCKRYSQAVGNNAVQEVFAGKFFYHCHVGAVVTNSRFTQSAIELAKENGVVLWDRSFLDKYVNANGVPQIVGINDNCNTLEIYDVEHEIVAIKDEVISKALFEYMDAVSRTAIDMYIEKGNENEYSQEMLNCIKEPILFYNAKFILALGSIQFIYYCKMGECFKNTKAYAYLKELSEKSSGKFEDDLFQINVFYEIDDIVLLDKDVQIKQFPEISILPENMDTMKCLEDLDEYDLQSNDECYITENYFVMKMENIKIFS